MGLQFDGGAVDGILSLDVSSLKPQTLAELNSHSTYVIGRRLVTQEPHCISKFLPAYGPLYWPQTWAQVHLTSQRTCRARATSNQALVDVITSVP